MTANIGKLKVGIELLVMSAFIIYGGALPTTS